MFIFIKIVFKLDWNTRIPTADLKFQLIFVEKKILIDQDIMKLYNFTRCPQFNCEVSFQCLRTATCYTQNNSGYKDPLFTIYV